MQQKGLNYHILASLYSAEYEAGKSVARQLFSMVPFVHLKETLTLIIKLFEKSNYKIFQLYAHYILNKYSEDFLSLWHLYNLKNKTSLTLPKQDNILTCKEEEKLLFESFANFELIENNFKKTVSALVKGLWTVEGKDPHYKPPLKRVNAR